MEFCETQYEYLGAGRLLNNLYMLINNLWFFTMCPSHKTENSWYQFSGVLMLRWTDMDK